MAFDVGQWCRRVLLHSIVLRGTDTDGTGVCTGDTANVPGEMGTSGRNVGVHKLVRGTLCERDAASGDIPFFECYLSPRLQVDRTYHPNYVLVFRGLDLLVLLHDCHHELKSRDCAPVADTGREGFPPCWQGLLGNCSDSGEGCARYQGMDSCCSSRRVPHLTNTRPVMDRTVPEVRPLLAEHELHAFLLQCARPQHGTLQMGSGSVTLWQKRLRQRARECCMLRLHRMRMPLLSLLQTRTHNVQPQTSTRWPKLRIILGGSVSCWQNGRQRREWFTREGNRSDD